MIHKNLYASVTEILQKQKEKRGRAKKQCTKTELATTAAKQGIWRWILKMTSLEWDNNMFKIFNVEKQMISIHKTWNKTLLKEDLERSEKTTRGYWKQMVLLKISLE